MRRILWFDCAAAGSAGVLVLLAHRWLAPWYAVPANLLLGIAIVNLSYGAYGFTLVKSRLLVRRRVAVLIGANAFWAVVCALLAFALRGTATWLALAHFLFEGAFVGALAIFEWRRWRLVGSGWAAPG